MCDGTRDVEWGQGDVASGCGAGPCQRPGGLPRRPSQGCAVCQLSSDHPDHSIWWHLAGRAWRRLGTCLQCSSWHSWAQACRQAGTSAAGSALQGVTGVLIEEALPLVCVWCDLHVLVARCWRRYLWGPQNRGGTVCCSSHQLLFARLSGCLLVPACTCQPGLRLWWACQGHLSWCGARAGCLLQRPAPQPPDSWEGQCFGHILRC